MATAKTSQRSVRGIEGDGQLVILLPDPLLLRLIARSVLLAAAILSFPWIRCLVQQPTGNYGAGAGAPDASLPTDAGLSCRWVDDPLLFPMLIRDLRREGLLGSEGRHVFIGDPGARVSFLKRNGIDLWASGVVRERSVDFVMVADVLDDAGFVFVERALRIGGIVVVRLNSDPERPFRLPMNYRIVYIRRFGSTVVAIKKTAHADCEDNVGVGTGRKLLGSGGLRKNVMNGLEDLLLEPPTEEIELSMNRIKYLPELMGLSLDQYPRRVFIDVGLKEQLESGIWFEKEYPKKNTEFEIVRLSVEGKEDSRNAREISDWLRNNVREEEYVVMKAEAEEVEVMIEEKTIGLVDELFLECMNEWQNGVGHGRAYWQCLALNVKLRDVGIAVHQWWG